MKTGGDNLLSVAQANHALRSRRCPRCGIGVGSYISFRGSWEEAVALLHTALLAMRSRMRMGSLPAGEGK